MFNAILDFLFNGIAVEISLAINKAWTGFMLKRHPNYNSDVSSKVIKIISFIISFLLGLVATIVIIIVLVLLWMLLPILQLDLGSGHAHSRNQQSKTRMAFDKIFKLHFKVTPAAIVIPQACPDKGGLPLALNKSNHSCGYRFIPVR